jgi:hypothetical protein
MIPGFESIAGFFSEEVLTPFARVAGGMEYVVDRNDVLVSLFIEHGVWKASYQCAMVVFVNCGV